MKTFKKDSDEGVRMPDSKVVERVLQGEKELFEILMRRYNQTLYRAVRSYARFEDDIEDIMQDTYLKAFQKLHQFRGEAAFSTWLVRIGINEALQKIRKRRQTSLIDMDVSQKIVRLPDSNSMNPEKKIIQHETRLLLENAIDRLPAKYRSVYVLREVEGMTNSEVSICLNLTESNVKVRHYRAKNLLKDMLLEASAGTPVFEFGNEKCDRLVRKVMKLI